MGKMAKTETVRARVEPELKRDAEAVLSELGLSTSEAITLFLRQITLRRGLPFPVHIPNQETREAPGQAFIFSPEASRKSLAAVMRKELNVPSRLSP